MILAEKHALKIVVFIIQLFVATVLFGTGVQGQTLAGYWTFDEGSGTAAADASGEGHTATLVNGVRWVRGRVGGAISANASQRQYVRTPAINLTATNVVTVAFWANRNYSTVGGHALFQATANYHNSTTGFGLFPDDANCHGIQATLKGDVGQTANCYNPPSSGVWHYIVVVYDKTQTGGNEVLLYIDGTLQNPTRSLYASTNTNNFGNDPIYLFSQGGTTHFDSGTLDDFRIYTGALTAAQIKQLYSYEKAQIEEDFVVSVDGAGVMTTPSFSTSVNGELLVAFVSYDGPSNSAQTANVSGGGLTWALLERSNHQLGTSEIWAAIAPNAPFISTATSQPGSGGGYNGSLTVIGFINSSSTGAVAKAAAPSGAPDVSLAGVPAGNWVFAVGNDWDNAIPRVPVKGQVLVHQRVDRIVNDTYWVQSTGTPSTLTGTVDIHDTAPTSDQWNYAAVEIVSSFNTSQGTLAASPSLLNFGNVNVNSSSSEALTITNVGGKSVTVSGVSISGAEFSMSSVKTPFVLAPSASITLTTTFSPIVGGAASGSITVTSNATNPSLSIPFSGFGVQGTLAASPASLNFGEVNVQSSSTEIVILSNTGSGSVTVSGVSISGAEFSLSSVTTPFVLAPSASQALTATFSPTVTGAASGNITVNSNATNPTLSIPLSGTGVTGVQHWVTLTWDASTSRVVGYNVYRSNNPNGPFTILNSGLLPLTTYVDKAVQSDNTYYYYATAVNIQGQESVPSNHASATVPSE